jgi:hypothetical protein
MIRDGINETGREEKLVAKDLAEIVASAMEETTKSAVPSEQATG